MVRTKITLLFITYVMYKSYNFIERSTGHVLRRENYCVITGEKTGEDSALTGDLAGTYLDAAGVIIAVVDSSETITMVNRKACDVLGYSENELIGRNWFDCLVPEEEKQEGRLLFHQIMSGQAETVARETRLVTKDGQEILASFYDSTLRDGEGNIIGRLLSGEDITERRRAEHKLQEEQRLNSLLLSSIPHPAMVVGRDCRVVVANRAAEEKGVLIGGHCWKLFGDACENDGHNGRVNAACCERAKCSFCRMDNAFCTLEGQNDREVTVADRIWDIHWIPLDSRHLLHYAIDITERVDLEEQLHHSQVLASLGEMTAGIAHEVGNPLASIMLYSEVAMKNSDIGKDTQRDLRVIQREAKRAGKLMKDLLTYSRKLKPKMERLDMACLIEEAAELRRYQEKVRNIRLRTIFAEGIFKIRGDYTQITQVLLNLLINAEEALEEQGGGTITVSCREECGSVNISIADTGPGIPEQYIGRIFNPFFTTKKIGEGTGLGLSTCYGIVTAHNGIIRARNKDKGGAVFTVQFPALREEEQGVLPFLDAGNNSSGKMV